MNTALILETNNLASLDAHDDLERVLSSLLRHLRHQTHSLEALDELVVTHDGLSFEHRERLQRIAGRPIQWLQIAADMGYYAAKSAGFDATTADVVVFADSDCWPVAGWLDSLVAPFDDPDTMVVAGRTTYPDDVFGIAATTVDFPYFRGRIDGTVRNFYANNVAFRRETFARFGYHARPGVYRGHCQVLGMDLWRAGVDIVFADRARTIHELPDELRELVRLRLYRGADTTALARDFVHTYGGAARGIARSRAASVGAVLGGRLLVSQHRLNRQDMPKLNGQRRIAARGIIAAISATDGVGAMLGLLGRDLGVLDGNAAREVRAYHVDQDAMRARRAAPTAEECAA